MIGAGSAGCAVAGRLADARAGTVAVLEAGGHDCRPAITVPIGFASTVPKPGPFNYGFTTEPQRALGGRRGYQPRGRVLGGSSSINGMIYIRGTPSDYDGWAAAGCEGWGWSDVLPYFKRAECNERLGGGTEDDWHGGSGPLHVVDTRSLNPFDRRFVEAAQAAGYRYNHDFNGAQQEGIGFYQRTQRDGERWNTARAYLHGGDASSLNGGRPNLDVLTDTQVLRIVFENKRATGVAVVRGGVEQVLRARREIILTAGAFGSPQLLMASGIGPAGHLRDMGIDVIHDAPEVGQNLQEHPDMKLGHRLVSADLYAFTLRGALRLASEWRRYRKQRFGMFASNIAECGGFLKSRPDLADPDLQLHFTATLGDPNARNVHGYCLHVCVLRPRSRGEVLLASPDARQAPKIDQNLLADAYDMETLLAGTKIIHRILGQEPLARLGGKPHKYGHLRFDGSDDEAVRELIRERADVVFHPVGTCRMGSDSGSVVDPQLRVRGVEGLRVADASVMPALIGGNTNAPAIMIGEKAADLVRGIARAGGDAIVDGHAPGRAPVTEAGAASTAWAKADVSRAAAPSISKAMLASALVAALSSGAHAVTAPDPAKPASATTAASNAAVHQQLPFTDRADYEAVERGLVAPFRGEVRDASGRVIWNPADYDFLRAEAAPDTVNPSLWRMAQLNAHAGLFRVTDGVYQVRGMDLANMSIIEGRTGVIVVDPLTRSETARAALELYYANRPRKPVVAVIYSHSHVDHFGGVRGVVDEADVKAGKVAILAPAGFMQEAASENVFAGTAMFRRAIYQGGYGVVRGARGQVDTGIGKGVPLGGTTGLIPPTVQIVKPYEARHIDGVAFEFQLTPGTEAPAEMNFYLPGKRALCMAENATRTMHNILTPRGALVRDPKAWGRFLDASLVRYGDRADVLFAQHNWPTWGGENIRTMLADERDMYTFLNDRTLHLINQGMTPLEIADTMKKLPGKLDQTWYTRGYYGSLSFNARAVYQRYMGFYDGNPANLDPLPPVESGKRYVQAMGGSGHVLDLMRDAMAKGDFRWAAQLGNNLVFAEPGNTAARQAQADTLEQLAYQSENSLWRNMYLSGAKELRGGVPTLGSVRNAADLVRAMEPSMFFDYMGVRLDSDKAQGHDMTLNWVFTDLGKPFALTLRNGVLTYRENSRHARADATVTMTKATLDGIGLRELDLPQAVREGKVKVEGDAGKLTQLIGMLATFDPSFGIVAPLATQ
ncbi:alkyl sulfatase dimerization domain-containing protein [Cupriavidus necator]|uniref:alkyl sulfatase dimerization domain-containing protein n=1 Tax=Cupriavidus necator TaxID=106590 RepID=UPI001E5C2E01|nr:alkyl sulfatase dimerization domain-containing protein [Cupriavidus necator]